MKKLLIIKFWCSIREYAQLSENAAPSSNYKYTFSSYISIKTIYHIRLNTEADMIVWLSSIRFAKI